MVDVLWLKYEEFRVAYDGMWSKRDRRMDDWPMMSSPLPTLFLCLSYVFIVKVAGPNYMKDRKPMNIRGFLIVYNLFQVVLSTWIFVELLFAGWAGDYSFRCQPVDYSDNPKAKRMLFCCWLYYMSKFTEFFDTFAFVARKKFSHVSLLHVVHHGIMPLSVWPGARFFPGGHATFFGLCNTFVHIFMYIYYFMAALGPQYQKYIWWKQHMTTLQMIQFVAIMVHGFQLLLYDDCDFPWQLAYYIAAHAVMFFFLFAQFYVQAYLKKPAKKTDVNGFKNGSAVQQNGHGYNTRNGTSKKEL